MNRQLNKTERDRFFDTIPTAWLRLMVRDVIEREWECVARFEQIKLDAAEHRDMVLRSLALSVLHFARIGKPRPNSALAQPDAEGQDIFAEWQKLLDRFVTQEAKDLRDLQLPAPRCDHKFIDSNQCLKCGQTAATLRAE